MRALSLACAGLSIAGGVVLLATALMVTASVLLRWLAGGPIPGDFELVSIGAGIAGFLFLAQGTRARANILVDTFTTWLPLRVQQAMDAFWHLAWAGVALFLAERMLLGTSEMRASATVTMVLALPTWWAVGIGAMGLAITGVAALAVAGQLARGRRE